MRPVNTVVARNMQTHMYWEYIISLCTALPVIYNSLTVSAGTISVQSAYMCVCGVFRIIFPLRNTGDIFSVVPHPLVGQGLLNIEASRSHAGGHTTLGRIPLDE